MGLISVLVFMISFVHSGYAEMKVSDFWNPNGAAKILWKNSTEEQKAQYYEWKRENEEYVNANVGKKCSELKNIPEYTKFSAMGNPDNPSIPLGPNEICFPPKLLKDVYYRSREYDKWFEEERKYYENRDDRRASESQLKWFDILFEAGHYREAEKFFPELVNNEYPWYKKEEVVKRLKNGERAPKVLSKTIIAEPWDRILSIKGIPDDLMKPYREDDKEEISGRMHHYFHSKNDKKRAEALEFYSKNKVRFMIEKAKKDWKGDLKTKAETYSEELQKSTATQ